MKLLVLILAVSAATNAALVTAFVNRPTLAPAGVRDLFHLGANSSTAARDTAKSDALAREEAKKRAAAKVDVWASLHTAELTDLVARLRAAGFPATIVRAIVDAEVERRYSGRIKELTRSISETPYWKPDATTYGFGPPRVFEELSGIYRERSRVLRELLGKDALAYGVMDPSAAQRRQYGNLPQTKIDLVQRISDDYAEMTGQIRTAMQGITLPEDREKLALLEREKRADLAAILTPEELADYEMRTSPLTSRLRTAFTIMDATEAEFRQLYQIQQPYTELLYPTGVTMFTPEMSEKRREAQKQIMDQAKATLGEARFAEYQRATNSEFQQLYRLGQRDNIPYEALARAFDTRVPAAEASTRIQNDRSLTEEQRRDALKQLAQTTRTQILSTLGPSAGPAYVDSSRWLTYIEQGGSVSLMPDGNMSYRSPPRPATPGAGPAPTTSAGTVAPKK